MPYASLIRASLMIVLLSVTHFAAAATASGASPDAVSNATIALPPGKYSALKLLASAVNGYQLNQPFVVTYTDGSTTKFTQSLSNWWGPPQHYTGESQVMQMPDLVTPTGATLQHAAYVYGYLFALNSSKTVESITLPKNRNVVVLAVDVGANGATPIHVSLTAVDNVVGIVGNGTAATNGGWDNEGYAYSASLLGTSITWAGSTFTLAAAYPTTTPPGQRLQISGTPAATVEVGQFYSFTPTIVTWAGSSLAYTVVNKPAWTQFSATTGTLSGTPSTGSEATDSNIVVSVSNGAHGAALPAFQITVEPALATEPVTHIASLSWSRPVQNTDGSPLTNLAGYVIRYGTSTAALNTRIPIASPGTTSVEITSLTPGNWYFEVAAVNTLNVEGRFSTIVDKTIL